MYGSRYQYGFSYGSTGTGEILPVTADNVLWLDADDASTILEDTGVSNWLDKSGEGNDVVQTTAGERPLTGINTINGRNVITFDGVNDSLVKDSFTATANTTIFMVFRVITVTTEFESIFTMNGLRDFQIDASDTTPNGFRARFLSVLIGSNDPPEATFDLINSPTLMSYRLSLSNGIFLRINGVDEDDDSYATSISTIQSIFLGKNRVQNNFSNVDIGEVIVYNRELTSPEIVTVETYLRLKWGLISPTVFPNNVLWLDGQDDTTLTDEGGGEISAWADKSGQTNDVTQGVSVDRPLLIPDVINGLPGLEFDGNGDFLENTLFSNDELKKISVFVVGNYRDFSDQTIAEAALEISNGSNRAFFLGRTPLSHSGFLSSTGEVEDDIAFDKARIYVGISDGILLQYYIDGVLRGTDNGTVTVTPNQIRIGSDLGAVNSLKGPIGEVVIYDRVLSDSERIVITNYLAEKWNIDVFNNDIAGNKLWLDAVDETVISTTGSRVTQWDDKSGLNNHVTQVDDDKRPLYRETENDGAINEMHTVVFDGVDDKLVNLSFSSMTSLTIISVFRYDQELGDVLHISDQTGFLNFATFFYRTDGLFSSSKFEMEAFGSIAQQEKLESPQLHVYTGVINDTIVEYFLENNLVDSSIINNSFSTPLNVLGIGGEAILGGSTFNGAMGEAFIFNRGISSTERETVVTYLADKWGIVKPTIIPDNILWLDATDSDTIIEVDGAVSQWSDKSGNDNHVIQTTPDDKPNSQLININGLAAISFDGVDDFLENTTFPDIDTYSIFVVGEYASSVNQTMLNLSPASGGGVVFSYQSPESVVLNDFTEVSLLERPKLGIYTAILDSSEINYYVNNSLKDSDSSAPIPETIINLTLGANIFHSSFLNGYIGEVIIYNRALSDKERDYIFDYLAEKWAILDVSKIQGNLLWLDAPDDTTIIESSGNITEWGDKSGEGNNVAVQGGIINQPHYDFNSINGVIAVDFDGVDQFLTNLFFPDLNKFSIFVVARPDSLGTDQGILQLSSGPSSNNGVNFYYDDASNSSNVSAFDGAVNIASKTEDAKLHIYAATLDGLKLRYFIDDPASPVSETASGPLSNVINRLTIGSFSNDSFKFKGQIGEIIIFNREVSRSERETIFSYLTRKWKMLDVSSIAGNELWLNATDFNSITTPLAAVSSWKDISGQGHEVVQVDVGKQPIHTVNQINGLPAVLFDGVDDFLEDATFTDLSTVLISVVAKYATGVGGELSQSILDISDGASNSGVSLSYVTNLSELQGNDGSVIFVDFVEPQSLHIYTGIIGGGNIEYYLDGELKDSDSSGTLTNTLTNLLIGKSQFGAFELEGPIGEIIITTTTTDRTLIERYLSNKWRIALKG